MKAVYLLPCSCGKKVPVDAGQAGAKVTCECGQQLAVPTFRALRDLEQEKPVAAVAVGAAESSEWNPVRGIMFSLGMLLSLIAAVLICYHLYTYWVVWDGGEAWKQDHLKEMRDSVDYLAPADALAEFQDMATKGLTVDGVPPWSQVATMRESSRRWLLGALVTLAVGLVSLTASLIGAGRSKAK
jgi:hypothetical protein